MGQPDSPTLAKDYATAVHAARGAGIAVEPEAQLTTPVARLLVAVAEEHALDKLAFLRETQLAGVRPDFGILASGRFTGWLELKAPGIGVDPNQWTGRNRSQWKRLAELENLLLCDGEHLRLFRTGEPDGDPCAMPYVLGQPWERAPIAGVLRRFTAASPSPIRSAAELARRLAPLARDLRERIEVGLGDAHPIPELTAAHNVWREMLRDDITASEFADALAQVVAYALVIATLDGTGDANQDGVVSLEEAESALAGSHRVLAATLRPLLEIEGLREALRSDVGGLERMLGAVDSLAIAKHRDPRGDAWLWFYEEFLGIYDPQARKRAGVYYTPVPVVGAIIRLVEHVLVHRFHKPLGFGDRDVVTLDPAVGTGTFPLAALDAAADRARTERGPAGPQQVAPGLAARVFGLEVLPGPFAVAHLRVGERLREMGANLDPEGAQLLLADTLDTPDEDPSRPQLELFGAHKVLADEAIRARRLKRETRVMAVVGNPPYRRLRADRVADPAPAGGWVTSGRLGKPWRGKRRSQALFDDVVAASRTHTIFSHVASLYNLYVYFWRWAIWKAFEQHGDGPAVIGFITGASWLNGPGLFGLRELAREVCDELWICDLGGDNRGARPEENVFAIETPVAIALLIRHDTAKSQTPARVRYRRLYGTSVEKLAALDTIVSPDEDPGAWQELPSERGALFVPAAGDAEWEAMPALRDLLPWQQPGAMLNRTWPVAPDRETLRGRWASFMAADEPRRHDLFPDPASGRRITTHVGNRATLAELPADAAAPPIVRYGWRPFDDQWTFEDPRLAKTESPSLWQARSARQIYLAFPSAGVKPGAGPTVWPTVHVPDRNAFKGSAGGQMFALYRDAEAQQPNVPARLLSTIGRVLRLDDPSLADPTVEDFAAYLVAVLATPTYQQRFETELADQVVRVPVSADAWRFTQAMALGRRLLWLQTGAKRLVDPTHDRPNVVPPIPGLGWKRAVRALPEAAGSIIYAPEAEELRIADGVVSGVRADVWAFAISTWPVAQRWLEQRTAAGRGRRSSDLDAIRPAAWQDEWNDELLVLLRILTHTLDLRPEQDELLAAICDGPLIAADTLPSPTRAERQVPYTLTGDVHPGQTSTNS